jgi:quercetin dioxygenase-like cupin family protein
MRLVFPLAISILLITSFIGSQQSGQQPVIAKLATSKLASVTGAPDCATYAVEHGDIKGASSVTLVKLASGCTMPMHWHSADEEFMLASGAAQVQMRGEESFTMAPGDYYYMPAHHHHQTSCPSGCMYFRYTHGPLDIHYVDAAGNKIPAEKALAAFGERPAAAVTQR